MKRRSRVGPARGRAGLKAVSTLEGIETETIGTFYFRWAGLKAVSALEGIETARRRQMMASRCKSEGISTLEGIETLASCASLGLRSDAQSAFEQGLAQFKQGRYAEAIPHFVTATERDPEFAQAYLYLGRSYLNLSRWFEAIPALRTALQLAPEATQKETTQLLFDALLGAATLRFKQGDIRQAIPLFKESLALAPQAQQARQGLLNALLSLGGELLSQGKTTEAIATYTEITQMAPQSVEAYLGLARSLLRQGDLLKALTAIRNALRLAPNNGDALSLLQQMQRQ